MLLAAVCAPFHRQGLLLGIPLWIAGILTAIATTVVGGTALAGGKGEVIKPLSSDSFAALFFIDSGMIDSGGYRASVGTGIQILIPQWFGPVPMRLELATPLMKDGKDDTQVFSFSVGRLF